MGAHVLAEQPLVPPAWESPVQAAAQTSLQLTLQPQNAPLQCVPTSSARLAGVLQSGSTEDFANVCSGLTQRVSATRARAPDLAQQRMPADAAVQTGHGSSEGGLRPGKRARLDERPGSGAQDQQGDRGQEAAPSQEAGHAQSMEGLTCTGEDGVLRTHGDGQPQQQPDIQAHEQAGALLLTPVGLPGTGNVPFLPDAQCDSMADMPMRLSAILRCCPLHADTAYVIWWVTFIEGYSSNGHVAVGGKYKSTTLVQEWERERQQMVEEDAYDIGIHPEVYMYMQG